MRRFGAFLASIALLAVLAVAYSGHEIPVYPSYYPQEIRIEALEAPAAGRLLAEGKLHAYVGRPASFDGTAPRHVQRIESLGAYLVLSINPAAHEDERAACALAQRMMRELQASAGELLFHPYPVTPLHAAYLYHADLAAAAKAQGLAQSSPGSRSVPEVKVVARGALAAGLVRGRWKGIAAKTAAPEKVATKAGATAWDAALEEIDAGELVAGAALGASGWLGPPWLKDGWFHADRLLAGNLADAADRARVAEYVRRLQAGDYDGAGEAANLQRALVQLLTRGCRRVVVGYTLKHEHVNTDYTTGIENIGYDSQAGLNSAIFIRTVKLKDFPWNGWLRLGVATPPEAAWNPIAGFGDDAGRLIWLAVGDSALFPAPYGRGWEVNRLADVQVAPDAAVRRTRGAP
jgi:hypothetical protein